MIREREKESGNGHKKLNNDCLCKNIEFISRYNYTNDYDYDRFKRKI